MSDHVNFDAQALLTGQEEQNAYLALQATLRRLISDEKLPVKTVFKAYFVLGILGVHQETGSLLWPRVLFERVMRSAHHLFYPESKSAIVIELYAGRKDVPPDLFK